MRIKKASLGSRHIDETRRNRSCDFEWPDFRHRGERIFARFQRDFEGDLKSGQSAVVTPSTSTKRWPGQFGRADALAAAPAAASARSQQTARVSRFAPAPWHTRSVGAGGKIELS